MPESPPRSTSQQAAKAAKPGAATGTRRGSLPQVPASKPDSVTKPDAVTKPGAVPKPDAASAPSRPFEELPETREGYGVGSSRSSSRGSSRDPTPVQLRREEERIKKEVFEAKKKAREVHYLTRLG